MRTHIHEAADGVLLSVEYESTPTGIELLGVRVLGPTYECVGPNLMHFLHGVCTYVPASPQNVVPYAEPFLNHIVQELPC